MVLRAGGLLSMAWSLVVLGAPAPLSDCMMPSASPATHVAMGHHGAMAEHMHGTPPATPPTGRTPVHSACCVTACGCAAFVTVPATPALAAATVAFFATPQLPVARPSATVRSPHSLPFAHAPPLS